LGKFWFFVFGFVLFVQYNFTTSALKRATARHGVKMDQPNSRNQIDKFIATYGVNIDECEKKVNKIKYSSQQRTAVMIELDALIVQISI
jgi:hypothetical protein